jgi:hypothetical protein
VEDVKAFARAAFLLQASLDLGAVAHEDDPEVRPAGDRLDRAGYDRAGGVVPAHGVQGDLHGLLLLFHVHHGAALVVAAVGADAVRQHGVVALRAVLDLYRLEVVMTPPLALPGVGGTSLGDCHEYVPSLFTLASERSSC